MGTLARSYRECHEQGRGELDVLDQIHAGELAHSLTLEDATLVAVHNLAAEPVVVPLAVAGAGPGDRLVDLLAEHSTDVGEDGAVEVPLDGYGYRWLRLVRPGDRRLL